MRPLHILIFLSIICLSFFLLLRAAATDSITYDEPLHLHSALEWWSQGNSPSDPFNPPLSKLPSYLLSRLGVNLFSDPFLRLPRLTTIILAMIFLISFYLHAAKTLSSTLAALVALFLLALEPTFLAHAHLVTTDLMATFTFFLAVISWQNLQSHLQTFYTTLSFIIAISLLAATKITLFPALFLYIFIDIMIENHRQLMKLANEAWSSVKLKNVLSYITFSALIIWAVYGFRLAPILNLTYPVPLGGFVNTVIHAASASLNPKFIATRRFVYFGQMSGTGWFTYPLVSFLLKTSPSLLTLITFGCYWLFKQRTLAPRSLGEVGSHVYPELVERVIRRTLTPALAVMIVITLGRYSTGIRHLLPAIPFLCLFAAQALFSLPLKAQKLALALILPLHLLTAFTPDPIAYFNPAIGPKLGGQVIADSNLDWGQNLHRLAQELNPPNQPLYCAFMSPEPPSSYGLYCLPLPPTSSLTPNWATGKTITISRTVYYTQGYAQTFLKYMKPTYTAANTILVYHF